MDIQIIKKMLDQPASVLLEKVKHRLLGNSKPSKPLISKPLNYKIQFSTILDLTQIDINPYSEQLAEYLVEKYSNHQLDILGSGWVSLNYDAKPLGVESYTYKSPLENITFDTDNKWLAQCLSVENIEASSLLINKIKEINPNYKFIDWQRDIKSGFRYNAQIVSSENIKLTPYSKGADLKVAREISRMHHFTQMAWIAHFSPQHRASLTQEFICQSLDFIALNPIGKGVQWLTSMDIALRAANWVVAYDIFSQIEHNKPLFNDEIKLQIETAIFNHAEYIYLHREYRASNTNNHYLANISGLAILSSYFFKDEIGKTYFNFAKKELITEVQRQFFDDGGNFEGSTCYHALATEMVSWASSFVLHREKNAFNSTYINRLQKAITLFEILQKPNNQFPQVGDNDSGRMFRFTLIGDWINSKEIEKKYLNLKGYNNLYKKETAYFDEDQLNYSMIIDGFKYFNGIENKTIENQLIKFLLNKPISTEKGSSESYICNNTSNKVKNLSFNKTSEIPFPKTIDLNQITYYYYPNSGYFIAKSEDFYLLIIGCTNKKAFSTWGHFHNDKLSFELQIDKKNITFDKGSYLYTPSIEKRNEYRKTKAHNTVFVENIEQNRFYKGKFWDFNLMKDSKCQLLVKDSNTIILENEYSGVQHIRKFIIDKNKLKIIDYCNKEFNLHLYPTEVISNGYGKLTYWNK